MSQYGYGYGSSQPPEAYYQPSQTHPAPPYHSEETTGLREAAYGNAAQNSFDFNRNTIPGLALSASNQGSGWQQYWANAPSNAAPTAINSTNLVQGANQPSSAPTIAPKAQKQPLPDDDLVEEGELSEEQLEDIYEPRETNASGTQNLSGDQPASVNGRHQEASGGQTLQQPRSNAIAVEQNWETTNSGRDRSGSYSPYLSPREIDPKRDESSAQEPSKQNSIPREIGPSDLHGTPSSRSDCSDSVSEVKERARQAVLRLWPLNVRYQNYIDEGIDKEVLADLFKELGLDLNGTSLSFEKSGSSIQETAPDTARDRETVHNDKVAPRASESVVEPAKATKDKSEERKDRIARLLAAKETKPTTSSQEASSAKPPVANTAIASKAPLEKANSTLPKPEMKTHSEKSKLLQQKMEALRRARESNAKQEPLSQSSVTPVSQTGQPHISRLSATPLSSTIPATGVATGPIAPSQSPLTLERVDSQSAPSIPGLFLSSTQQGPTQPPNQRKRPVAADLNEASTTETYKRPFGQTRESRPFLIDVSDDEDDAEMEIDSPEQRPSSIQRPLTPSARTMSFRDYPALSDKAATRQFSSPSQAPTPTIASNGATGVYDLESMHKKIEDMKRKIAEAEARKRAKQSNNGSSSLPQSEGQSKEGSVDSNTRTPVLVSSFTTDGEGVRGVLSPTKVFEATSQALPKLSNLKDRGEADQRPSPARAASARLPLLEARRKEQLSRLEQLQAEVAKIERDIKESLQEEERLKMDAALDSREQSGVQSESTPAESAVASQPATSTSDPESGDSTGADESPVSRVVSPPSGGTATLDLLPDESNAERTEDAANEPKSSSEPQVAHKKEDVQDGTESDASKTDDTEQDVAMEEVADSSEEEDVANSSDGYEPPEVAEESSGYSSRESSKSFSPAPAVGPVLEASDADLQGVSTTSPITQPISTRDRDSTAEPGREAGQDHREPSVPSAPQSSFAPYESPLEYFRAYRFHPKFDGSVAGGLRSLTYSNKIDVKKEMCPEDLSGTPCPRGAQCEYQHFGSIQAPDDQILLQLGAYGNYEGEQKQQYIAGLRELLTDFRKREVKDFQTISRGIIEYRTQFHGDKTKILPLGNVAI